MSISKLVWEEGDKLTKAAFTIQNVGRVTIEVESKFPGSGPNRTPDERRAVALRHARLLARNLSNALERQVH